MVSQEEIMQLRAGREIDVLVAEKIMGWQLETNEPKLRKLQEYFSRDDDRKWWRAPDGGWHCDPPPYSSDIASVWQVVERMNSRSQVLFLSQSLEDWRAAFDEPLAISPAYISETSITVAICKAALVVAVGAQVGIGSGIELRALPATTLA